MALDDNGLSYIRRCLDDMQSDLFGDAELSELYDLTGENLAQTVALAVKQIMMSAVKLQSYKTKTGELDSDAVFSRLEKLHQMYLDEASRTKDQVSIVGMQSRPPRRRDYPAGDPRNPTLPRRRR